MTFGFSTLIDLLSWAAVGLIGLKLAVMLILLSRDAERRFEMRGGTALWWATKIAPLLAVPCLIAIALLRKQVGDLAAYALLMLFVVIAVPIAVWNRFRTAPKG